MTIEEWAAVDEFLSEHLLPPDPILADALRASADANLPPISVSPPQGKLLFLLAKLQGANNILEIGTLGGYSTIWLARALPRNGRLITLEVDPRCAETATSNIARAGLADVVELREGRALSLLPQIDAENLGPFDLVFIDADKESMADYYDWAVRLSKPGTLIIADNVVRGGAVVDPDSPNAQVQGVRQFYARVAADSRVTATAIQTVGAKGYDGFAMVWVKEPA